jgi:hypothetical protein
MVLLLLVLLLLAPWPLVLALLHRLLQVAVPPRQLAHPVMLL